MILPAVFGAGIYQISRFIDLFFMGRLPEGSFAVMAFADRLNQLPLGIIGIALGTAILPALSRFIAKEDKGGAQRIPVQCHRTGYAADHSRRHCLVRCRWAAGHFFLCGWKILTVEAGQTTSAVVAGLVVGLPAYVMVKVLIPGFFARKDTKTPVYTAGISLLINISLNLILIPLYGIVGLAIAGAIAAWCNCRDALHHVA